MKHPFSGKDFSQALEVTLEGDRLAVTVTYEPTNPGHLLYGGPVNVFTKENFEFAIQEGWDEAADGEWFAFAPLEAQGKHYVVLLTSFKD